MPNLLSMALSDSIHTLHRQGWSARRIARELGVDRETVSRRLKSKPASAPIGESERAPDSKPANAPIGKSTCTDDSKPATAPIDSDPSPNTSPADISKLRRASDCEPYRAVIIALLDQGLTAQRIYQELVADHGFLDRFLHHAEIIRLTGRSYRLRGRASEVEADSKPANAPIGESEIAPDSKPANAPIGKSARTTGAKPAKAPTGSEVENESDEA